MGYPKACWLIKRAAGAALDAEGVDVPCEVFVMLTDNNGIHEINLETRNVDSATDVLSFPQNELTPGAFSPDNCEKDLDNGAVFLGDMVISLERCDAQAEEYGHSLERELSYLTVHSILHLLGYDHMDEGEQKRQMRAREDAIMEKLGL
jgi:probable rRNA maturation factor